MRVSITALLLCLMSAAAGAATPSLSVIGTIPGPDGGWDIPSVDAGARRLYIAHGDAVMAVDLDSGKVTPKLVEGKRLHAVLPLPDGRALSTNGGDNTATLFEAATGKVIAAIPTGMNPDAVLFEPATGLALVMDGKGGDITLIDPKTAHAEGRIDVGGKLEFAVADGKGRVFVNVEDKAEIAAIDIAQRKVTGSYKLDGCEQASGLALDPDTGLLLAACANRKAVAVQAKDGSVVATLAIGERPDGAIFDAKRKLFFIPCGAGSIAVIAEDGAQPTVVATIPTANGARTAALDPQTGKLYLPTADFAPPADGEKRHTVVPGTFRVLIVGEK
ncbi:MAG TPA: YncE family protein [Alphaproteobacteria bacterium]|jgi:DNA-binding beta-propeller fold protein YncE|nr:YncE family protein [Alphaproteobacteria bacterium]